MPGKKKESKKKLSKGKVTAKAKASAKSNVVVKIDQRRITKGRASAPAPRQTTTFIGSSPQPQFIPQYHQPQQSQVTPEVIRNIAGEVFTSRFPGTARKIEEIPASVGNWDTNSDYFSLDMLSEPSIYSSTVGADSEYASIPSTIKPDIRIGNTFRFKRVVQNPPTPPASISSSQMTPPGAFDISETSSTRNRRIEELTRAHEFESGAFTIQRPYDGLTENELNRYAAATNTTPELAQQLLRRRLRERHILPNSDISLKAPAAVDILARAEKKAAKTKSK